MEAGLGTMPFLTGLSIRFHRRHFWKLRQGGIHKCPRLRTVRVEVHGWPVPSGVIQTTGHDSDHGRCSCGPGKQAGTTIGTKAATYQISAVALYVEIFDFASDPERIPRHTEYRHKSATARSLAIAAMTIGSKAGINGTFVGDRAAAAAPSEGPCHF